jgi:hypothetical protein
MCGGQDAGCIVRPYGTLLAHIDLDIPEVKTSGNKMNRPAGTDEIYVQSKCRRHDRLSS